MKIELSVLERLWLLNNCLPKQGKVTTLKIVQDLIGQLGLSGDELADLEIHEDGGQIKWNSVKEQEAGPKAIDFGAASVMLIADQLKKMSEDETLELSLLPLYDKFVGDEG